MELELKELMILAGQHDVSGITKGGLKFITKEGYLYTWNRVTEEWVRPSITSFWFNHKFIVTKIKVKVGDGSEVWFGAR